jgi:hypothetical protein
MWSDEHWAKLPGGRAVVELVDGNVYLAFTLRNIGNGLGVLQSWQITVPLRNGGEPLGDISTYRPHTRDLYVPSGDMSFWQAGLRDTNDPLYVNMRRAIERREPFGLDLFYTDDEGGQRTVSRFAVRPWADSDTWMVSVYRHWHLDHTDPRIRPTV